MMGDRVSTCLWFRNEAEEAARFYVSVVPGSRMLDVVHMEGFDGPLVVTFELGGRSYMALNGAQEGFTPAHSVVVTCEDQPEIDRIWSALVDGGGREVQCGWLTDRYGMSWQIVPSIVPKVMAGTDGAAKARLMQAVMQQVKLDIAALEDAVYQKEATR